MFLHAKGLALWDGSIRGNGRKGLGIQGVMALIELVL